MKFLVQFTRIYLEKIRWNLHYRIRLLRLRLWGRKMICSACGQPIGSVILGSRKGKIHLEWLEEYQVFVDFASRNEVQFRHVDQGECLRANRSSAR